MQQSLPAWKRIGLKLKYAKDPSHRPYQSLESEINGSSNGKHELNETTNSDDPTPPPKKRRLSLDTPGPRRTEVASIPEGQSLKTDAIDNDNNSAHVEDHSTEQPGWEDTNEEQGSLSRSSTSSNQQSRRKSVTFTPETKQDDGLSASNLFKHRSPSQRVGESEVNAPQSDPAPTQPSKKPGSTKVKRPRERQKTEAADSITTSDSGSASSQNVSASPQAGDSLKTSKAEPSREARDTGSSHSQPLLEKSSESKAILGCIEYLEQFSQDRSSWRFNKKKQTTLLKHLFDVRLIPPQHNQAIIKYISGLQGEAARQRVIEDSKSILEAIARQQEDFDMESMESEEARRKAYASALKKHLQRYERSKAGLSEYDEQQLADMKCEIDRGQRAEALLFEALQKELYPEQYQQAKTISKHIKGPLVNGIKKSETPVTTTTNSSQATGLKRKKRKTRTAATDDSTSSSSSDSDSDRKKKRAKGPTTIREALAVTEDVMPSKRSRSSTVPSATGKGTRKIFDDDLLDKKFPLSKSYNEVAPKRKSADKDRGRGFMYMHGTKDDESGSESD